MTTVFINGFVASLVAGMFTGIGGMGIFLKKKYFKADINMLLNLAAGVMLSASLFSLLVPSMQDIVGRGQNVVFDALGYVGAIWAGVLLVWILNIVLPHEHNSMGHHGPYFDVRKAWLFIIAITLHKIPEGLAVGVAYGAEHMINPMSLVIGIAIHNIPEGLTIAISLIGAGYSKLRAVWVSFLIGFMQPIGALVGLLLTETDFDFVPYGMALAGGTMLFVVINEILPETYGQKSTNKSAAAVFIGFIVMTYLVMVFHD